MKFTGYFGYMRQRSDRVNIKIEWIEETVTNPEYTQVQSDGRIRKWRRIEQSGKYLRVILLPDGETVHNVFFDRNFRGK